VSQLGLGLRDQPAHRNDAVDAVLPGADNLRRVTRAGFERYDLRQVDFFAADGDWHL